MIGMEMVVYVFFGLLNILVITFRRLLGSFGSFPPGLKKFLKTSRSGVVGLIDSSRIVRHL